MLDQILGTFVGRWYVTLFGATFLWRASRHLGWRKTWTYFAFALGFGLLAENLSTMIGLPYTTYSFNENLRDDELWVHNVPLMVALSYSFMGYFAFTAGRMIASGPLRTRAPRAWHELLVGWMLGLWAVWILDPVSRLGDEFYLGELFRYRGPGFWFGLPLGSQAGFAVTSLALIWFLHRLDRDAPDRAVARVAEHPHLVSLVTYHAQTLHLAGVALYLGAHDLGGSALLMWFPAAVVTAVHWSQLRSGAKHQVEAAHATHEPAGLPLEAGDGEVRVPGDQLLE